jgi:malate permease and related proteins
MVGALLTFFFFIALGIGWRFAKPDGISADALQKQIVALVLWVLLPLVVFLTVHDLPLNTAALKILLYVLGTTVIALGIAWFWLSKLTLHSKVKGAYLIAAVFGNLLFIGVPLSKLMFADWTMRVAIEYMLVANVILLFTAGTIMAKSFPDNGKLALGKTATAVVKDYMVWLKEPVVWAALLGLIFNLASVTFPAWIKPIESMLYGALLPLLLLAVGLSLKWDTNWNSQLQGVIPVVVVQLIVVPLLMWGMVNLFGSAGLKTTKALMLDSMLPATLFGFVICARQKLDSHAYAMAFTVTSVLALVTVPIWYKILL